MSQQPFKGIEKPWITLDIGKHKVFVEKEMCLPSSSSEKPGLRDYRFNPSRNSTGSKRCDVCGFYFEKDSGS